MTFASYHLHHHHNTHVLRLQTITPEGFAKHLWNFGIHLKTHKMVTRYGNQDAEDIPDAQDSTPLHLTPQDHPMLEGDNDSSNEYCEKTETYCPLADLLQQFQQQKKQFASLKTNIPQSTSIEELSWLTDKLQHLTMTLQPTSHPVKNQYTRPYRHTWTPCVQHKGNQIFSLPCSKISPHLMDKTLKSWKTG